MDLIPASPLPPAPIAPAKVPQGQADLVVRLSSLGATLGYDITTKVLPGRLPAIVVMPLRIFDTSLYLRDVLGFDVLTCVSGVDMGDHFEVVYHLRSTQQNLVMQMTTKLPSGATDVDSLMGVWVSANWLERETFDMYGIFFAGHPDLRRILLDDEFEGFPLRKNFRPTPLTTHDAATTQVDAERALSGEQQRGLGTNRSVPSLLSQGKQERLHPGTPTFGSTQFHGRDFPTQTWKHTIERAAQVEDEQKKNKH